MKKFGKHHWVISFVEVLVGYSVMALLLGMALRFPNNLLGGVLAFAFLICLVAFGGDEEMVDAIKSFVTTKKSPSDVGAPDEDEAYD